jgi:pimeloyl-ACP methyl ester carboxylesterase
MRNPGITRPFRDAHGAVIPGSIAETNYFTIGGIDQWVMIRGENTANPVLILLYGGPGLSETALFRSCNASLEQSFTVVYWDQRGSGKSYDRAIDKSSMTVEQFLTDLEELVDIVQLRLKKPNVTILGHSWGSALGVLYAQRFPGRVAAYVGAAQIGNWPAAESLSYDIAIASAERLNHRKALTQLRAIGPPPYGAASLMTERTWLHRLDGQMKPLALWNMARVLFSAPESSLFELAAGWRAFRFSLDAMWDEVSKLNLVTLVPKLEVPVFFFVGGRDHWVPPETSIEYFDALSAPSKKLIRFENSGHEMFVDEPEKFNSVMSKFVRPIAIERSPEVKPDEALELAGAR